MELILKIDGEKCRYDDPDAENFDQAVQNLGDKMTGRLVVARETDHGSKIIINWGLVKTCEISQVTGGVPLRVLTR